MGNETAGSTPRPSFTIDGFEPLERLGSGGFGVVWKARQARIGRLVAIKVSSTILESEEEQRFFDRECESLGRLSGHPNIVQVHTTGHLHDGRPYLVLEYIDGGTLTKLIKSHESSELEVIRLGIDLCNGLIEAHRSGVLHRDIKPDNILLRSDGAAVLGDFGIALLLDSTKSQAGGVIGSLRYIAPEVLQGERPSVASDLYGIGITLYTAMIRQPPFGGASNLVDQIMQRVLKAQPESLVSLGYSKGLDKLVASLLAKSPKDRPTTAAHVIEHLKELERQAPTRTTLAPRVAPAPPAHVAPKARPTNLGPPTTEANPSAPNQNAKTSLFDPKEETPDRLEGTPKSGPGGTRLYPPATETPNPTKVQPNAQKRPSSAPDLEKSPAPHRSISVVFEGNEYASPKALAPALASHWEMTIWNLSGNQPRYFVEELNKAARAWDLHGLVPLLVQFPSAEPRRRHQLMTDLLVELDPDQPPTYRGWKIGNSERQAVAAEIPPAVVDEIRRGEILLRWRRNKDMDDIVNIARHWEDSIVDYDRRDHALRNLGVQVQDPLAGGKLLAASSDPQSASKMKTLLVGQPDHSNAGRQRWWAELYSSGSIAGLLLAQATFESAVTQTATLLAEEKKVARSRSRRSAITAAVAAISFVTIAFASNRWHALSGPASGRLTLGWLTLALTPLVFFWYLLATSKKRGIISGGCLGSLGWLVYLAAIGVVGGAVAMNQELAPETSAFGLFLTISTVTVPLVSLLTYRRLTFRLKSKHTDDTATSLSR